MPNYSFRTGTKHLSDGAFLDLLAPYAHKMQWFMDSGYVPHEYQFLFHTLHLDDNPSRDSGTIARFRHLVAGRRGGKTMSAAWEVLYYAQHPAMWHLHRRNIDSDKALHIWVLAKNNRVGRPALLAFREALEMAGFKKDTDYIENRSEMYFQFPNGSLVEFKTADDPQSLRGAGLDILWIDEAAFIPSREAWDVVRPALANKLGGVIFTTTPDGKNWYYEEFFKPIRDQDPDANPEVMFVEYRSLDNPYFPREEWESEKKRYHPLLFKQEYEASFDSMAGKELPGEWLTQHFYSNSDLPMKDGVYQIDKYIGIDPASSLSDRADRFVMALIGVSRIDGTVFLLDMLATRIPFAEQVEVIGDWYLKHRPQVIGIEAQAYQAVLAQQVGRLKGLPPVIPMFAKGKKSERILSMSPLFRIGRARVKDTHRDFIDEWLDYDSTLKNPKDDCLDAVEIALRCAGALFGSVEGNDSILDDDFFPRGTSLAEHIAADLPGTYRRKQQVDEMLGSEW